jgi:phage shock protein PspC (stress-responsive transcriptional regulator)
LKHKKPLLFFAVAVVVAIAIVQSWKPLSYSEQLILVQAKEELSHIDKRIRREPLEVQSVLLDYAADNELVLKAWIALSRYPEQARAILLLYGSEPEFKEILKNHGEAVIPAIQYFLENDVWSVKALDYSTRTIQSFADSAKRLWNRIAGNEPANAAAGAPAKPNELGPIERGWYAVNFIKKDGQHFLGQFVVDKDNKVKRNQTDRIAQAFISFFTGGVRALETKHDLGADVTGPDYFWAGLDVAVVALPLKLLRAGKVVETSGKALPLTTRTRLFAPRLVSKARIFQKLGKYGAVAATVYIIATHPSLINGLLAGLADLLELPPWLVQFVGWVLIVTVAIYPFTWLLKALARFTLFGLSWFDRHPKKIVAKTRQT